MRILAEWRDTDYPAEFNVRSYAEFTNIPDALAFASDKLRNGVAVHLQPLE